MEKIFKQLNFNYFFWTPLGSRVNIYKFLPSSSLHDVCSLILFPFTTTPAAKFSTISPSFVVTGGKFPAGVVDTCGNLLLASLTSVANLLPVSLTPVANLPPVSTTLGEMVENFAPRVVDTGGKFAASVVDTGGNFAAGTSGKFATGVVYIGGAPPDLRISPQIF
jgi:hypothetical protein